MPKDPTTRAPSTPRREFVEKTLSSAIATVVSALVLRETGSPELADFLGENAGLVAAGMVSLTIGGLAAGFNKLRTRLADAPKEGGAAKARVKLLGE